MLPHGFLRSVWIQDHDGYCDGVGAGRSSGGGGPAGILFLEKGMGVFSGSHAFSGLYFMMSGVLRARTMSAAAAIFLLVAGVVPAAQSLASSPEEEGKMPYVPLKILSGGNEYHFDVQVADTPARQAIGLMFRRELRPDRGMLFDFSPGRVVRMWMKNTFIPLDMLFVDDAGNIVSIDVMAEPLSLSPRGPSVPVRAVLELAGGACSRLGIRVGDRLSHALFESVPGNPVVSVPGI